MKNYRPVSNLSYLSKIIEEAAGRQMAQHLEKNSLNEMFQSAYKKGHSTETALISVFDNILTGMDKPNSALLIAMLDMSAAFDTVNHEILIKRLNMTFGITGKALQWFKSYLTDRTVCVSIGNTLSDKAQLDCSLPQGSKLGPRLYSDYTQPLGNLLQLLLLLYHCYADDTGLAKSMSLSSTDAQYEAVSNLGQSISSIQKWTTNNKLKLNPSKTEFMVACSTRNRPKVVVSQIDAGDGVVKSAKAIKSLGVIIDQSLSMEDQISSICRTCMFYINWIRKVRRYLTTEATKTLVQCYVITRIDYCNALLVALPKYQISRLQRIMNISARLIFQKPRDHSITELLVKLHWLKVEDRIVFKILCITWQSLNKVAPPYIVDIVTPNAPKRTLRSVTNCDLYVPKSRTCYGDRAFSCAAPKLWNSIPVYIRKQSSLPLFKQKLKTLLFRNSYFKNCSA